MSAPSENDNNICFIGVARGVQGARIPPNRNATNKKNAAKNPCFFTFRFLLKPISGRVDRASATEAVDSGSIPGRVKPKTIKIGIHNVPA